MRKYTLLVWLTITSPFVGLFPLNVMARPLSTAGIAASSVASHTPNPSSVTITGTLDPALGCAGKWDPTCAAAHLVYDANDDVWQNTWTIPAGNTRLRSTIVGMRTTVSMQYPAGTTSR